MHSFDVHSFALLESSGGHDGAPSTEIHAMIVRKEKKMCARVQTVAAAEAAAAAASYMYTCVTRE